MVGAETASTAGTSLWDSTAPEHAQLTLYPLPTLGAVVISRNPVVIKSQLPNLTIYCEIGPVGIVFFQERIKWNSFLKENDSDWANFTVNAMFLATMITTDYDW